MLNPIWLNTFKTLVDVGHFTQTAERLHMTQPGVSQHVSKLEAACGYPLIKRFNKQFELTVYGRKVYDYAVKHFEDESQLLQNLAHDEPFQGRCTIGCSGTFAWLLYAPLLALKSPYPKLSIALEATSNQRIFEQVQQGTLNIGLVTKKPNPKYFDYRIIGAEILALVLPFNADDTLPIDALLHQLGVVRHPDLAHYFQTYVSQAEDKRLNKVNIDTLFTQSYINQIHQILVPVAQGIGFTVVPKWCVDLFANKDRLHILKTTVEVQEPVYLISKLNSPLAKRYEKIIRVIENAFSKD